MACLYGNEKIYEGIYTYELEKSRFDRARPCPIGRDATGKETLLRHTGILSLGVAIARTEGEPDVKNLQTILADLRRLQPDLKARYPIREIGVFGSYARGEQTPDSDLDLLVDLGPGLTLIDLETLELELRDSLGMPVELAIKDALKARIEKRILAETVVV